MTRNASPLSMMNSITYVPRNLCIPSAKLLQGGLLLLASAPAAAQITFSVDRFGPTVGAVPAAGGAPLHQGDLLQVDTLDARPLLAAPNPVAVINRGGNVGAGFVDTLALPGYPANAEVDALSRGQASPVIPSMKAGSIQFSVDPFAIGRVTPGAVAPNVRTEALASEAAGSVFSDLGIPSIPRNPAAGPLRNVQVIDGNGIASATGFTTPGWGLVEPVPPASPPVGGDDLDALNLSNGGSGLVLFSLDGGSFDPLDGVPGSNSAFLNGFLPGAILASDLSGVAPVVWAGPGQLGLGAGDDIDALAVWDDGNKVYDPVEAALGWGPGGTGDMVLFSVRRGSPVIGQPDSLWGAPIEESDVLMPPIPGGMNPNPAILLGGEGLGLATRRSGTAQVIQGMSFADDLNALDVLAEPTFDCSGTGQEDAVDIAQGSEHDQNSNGIPDRCEITNYCTAGTSASGCQASLSASGIASATAASGFTLSASNVEGNKLGIFFFGWNGRQAASWGNGTSFQCVVPPIRRGGIQAANGNNGVCDGAFAQDLNALWAAAPGKNPGPGAVVQAQLWYRDPASTSNRSTSLSDAMEFVVCP